MLKNHNIYLRHILEASSKIERYVKNVPFNKFMNNEEKKDAVVRNLEIIGEAAAKIPQSRRKKYPDIEWRDIIDMRNRLIHEYFGVDFEIVWDVIKKELPVLKRKLKRIINEG